MVECTPLMMPVDDVEPVLQEHFDTFIQGSSSLLSSCSSLHHLHESLEFELKEFFSKEGHLVHLTFPIGFYIIINIL